MTTDEFYNRKVGYTACWEYSKEHGRCRAPKGHDGPCYYVPYEPDDPRYDEFLASDEAAQVRAK